MQQDLSALYHIPSASHGITHLGSPCDNYSHWHVWFQSNKASVDFLFEALKTGLACFSCVQAGVDIDRQEASLMPCDDDTSRLAASSTPESHLAANPLQCPNCGIGCKNATGLAAHRRSKHGWVPPLKRFCTSSKCQICLKDYRNTA
eukprot:6300594-Prorocentrum_lima.AAC.1